MSLDGDAALAFEIHVIEKLVLHLPLGNSPGELQDAVRQRRLPMVDVGDDGEISYVLRVHKSNDKLLRMLCATLEKHLP